MLGMGRNLPNEMFYLGGLGLPDLLLAMLIFWSLRKHQERVQIWREVFFMRNIITAVSLMGVFAMISMAFNAAIYQAKINDIFEIFRYYYQIVIVLTTFHFSRTDGTLPAVGFVVGALISGVVAALNPMNPDVLGVPQIFNPNVIGNVLSVSILICSVVILCGSPVLGVVLAISAAFVAFFTFSKGTWLMCSLAMLACFVALKGLKPLLSTRPARLRRYVSYAFLAVFVYGIFHFGEIVWAIIEAKIVATDFQASAADGGSVSARWGLIVAAIRMFFMNPLLGVGISNFELVNRSLELELGDSFYDDDNPNSAWFYVLSCMGLGAFICFAWVFSVFIKNLARLPMASTSARYFYVTLGASVVFIGGNVQLEMLTSYYYWVLLGILPGLMFRRPNSSFSATR
jgi:hypothetical protein